MKRHTKTTGRLRVPAMAVTDSGTISDSHSIATASCVNLRPEYGADGRRVLRSTGRPTLLTGEQLEVIGVLPAASGDIAILMREPALFYLAPESAEPVALGSIEGNFRCCTAAGGGLIVCDSHGSGRITLEGDSVTYSRDSTPEAYHDICLKALHHTMVTAEVASRRLQRNYSAGELQTDMGDSIALGKDLALAYLRLSASARAMGCYVQPVVARYKVYDRSMQELYCSAPQLLGHAEGVQCCEAQLLRSSDRRTIESYTLHASSWRMELSIPAGLPAEAAFVKVFATPQLHPYRGDAASIATLARDSSAGYFARLVLPGADAAFTASNIAGARALLMQLLARLDNAEGCVATFEIGAERSCHSIEVGSDRSALDEIRRIDRVLASSVTNPGLQLQSMLPPHRFTASTVCAGPGAVLWGGLKSLRYKGYPLTQMAATTAAKSWTGWVKVLFADGGESVVWSGGGVSDAPAKLLPLLSYPSGDAVRMAIGLEVNGEPAREEIFTLRAEPSLQRSLYIHPTLLPFELAQSDDGQTATPAANVLERDYADAVAVAPLSAPWRLQSMMHAGRGRVNAIRAIRSSQSAWDFGRPRFYLFCSGGILALNSTASLRQIAMTPVDSREVRGAEAVTEADGDIWAVASGDLIRLQGNRAVTARSACGYHALAWNNRRRELAGFHADGRIELTAFDHGMCRFATDFRLGTGRVYAPSGNAIYYSAAGGIYNLAEEGSRNLLDVELVINLRPLTTAATRIDALVCDMRAERISGTLSIRRMNCGQAASDSDMGLIIRGEVRSAIGSRLIARPARSWQLRLVANASDLIISEIILRYDELGDNC